MLVKVTRGCYSAYYIVKSDYRLGGVPRYILANKDEEFVMIPDEIRDCSCFVCYENKERQHIVCGTAFFIAEVLGVSGKDKNLTMTYSNVFLVTAKHLIDGIKLKYPNLPMGVRVNSTDGKTRDIVIPIDAWFYHPTDLSVDVAVLPWFSNEGLAFTTNPTYTAVTREVIRENGIGIGDEVFVIGLFTEHHGGERNLPIVRTGNIAMMPEEPVQTEYYGLMTAYLIELRSIGGLSGSPVYVHKQWADPKHKRTGHILYWLGMIHGHWNIGEKSIDMPIHDKEQQLNTGIGIVVPAYKILEVLDREEILAMREESKRNFTKRNIPVEDSGLKPR